MMSFTFYLNEIRLVAEFTGCGSGPARALQAFSLRLVRRMSQAFRPRSPGQGTPAQIVLQQELNKAASRRLVIVLNDADSGWFGLRTAPILVGSRTGCPNHRATARLYSASEWTCLAALRRLQRRARELTMKAVLRINE